MQHLADRMSGADAIGVVLFSDSPGSVGTEAGQRIFFAAAGPYMGRVCVSPIPVPDQRLDEILESVRRPQIQISHTPIPCSILIRTVQGYQSGIEQGMKRFHHPEMLMH